MSKIFKVFFVVLSVIIFIAVVAATAIFVYIPSSKAKSQEKQPSASEPAATTPAQDSITWGIDFSEFQAKYLGLDWKAAYLAMINDLGVKNIKIHTNWKMVEPQKDNYSFNDTDWQVQEAQQNNIKLIYVLGMKTGRWPECHIADWALGLSEKDQQDELLKYLTTVINRYKDSKAITYWQVENEPLFKFGECPNWYYDNDDFLKQEVSLVKSLDPSRQIIISDSGEQSNWFGAAQIGDIVGTTMYRASWPKGTDTFNSDSYAFLNPTYYTKKVQTIQKTFGKNVICIELQAEPWLPVMDTSLSEQFKLMNPDMFNEDVSFAKQTGLNTFYFWGAEWGYWLKTTQNQPQIWNEAKQLFQTGLSPN